METAERRQKIMTLLCRRRHETIENMAFEFGVSVRTIRRDIEILSLSEPIYTKQGRYEGGVYVDEDYSQDRIYMSGDELSLLHKVDRLAFERLPCTLSPDEIVILKKMIADYTKPTANERRKTQ